MVRERYTSDGVPEWQIMPSRDARIAARRAKYAPVPEPGFFRKVWKIVSGY